jgi:uncharacterized protein
MKRILALCLGFSLSLQAAEPLRVFIRGGAANRGNEVHAHPRFAKEWAALLNERGIKAEAGMDWPTAEQIKNTDVIVAYAQEGGDASPEQETLINDFTKRGGGLVVIHTAAVSMKNPGWWRETLGGAWKPGTTKWREGKMDLYFVENQFLDGGHPITKTASNFHFDDEIYYDMDIKPEARVLATSYTPNVREGRKPAPGNAPHIYDIQPQMWVYEKTAEGGSAPYRAFVSIPGHKFATFERPNYRAILLRGIAWAGKRANVDEFVKPEELSSLRYPEGGPMKPADTLANLEIHPDFTMKLVVAEPLITKPMNFDWAPDGSLWVAETPEYPNGRRGMRPDYRGKEWKDHGGIDPTPGEQRRAGQDKISRLADTDGDGVMDKKEVFYEGLDLVTGLVFHKDGVIVTQAPDILFLRDTNADGKADKVEKLYGNLGTGDTHAVINNPRWGWDGWIYATHGYSGSDKVTNAKGEKQPTIGSGVVRFRPDGSAIEQYSSKGGNTWGLTITGDNRVMWTQPTSGTILQHTVLPEYALARGKIGNTPSFKTVIGSPKSWPLVPWEQLAYVQIDLVGSFTATAGCVIYDGGAWPAEYNGDYFTTEPTINIIHHERLTPEKSSYTGAKLPGREQTEFIRSKDMWWRPIEVRVGPDGAVYVGDFYNQAVIHNDTRGPDHNRVNAAVRPDRDHYFGRIWKIEHKAAKKNYLPNFRKSPIEENLKGLGHANAQVRMTASRLGVEWAETAEAEARKNVIEGVGKPLLANWANTSADHKIAALWTLHRMAAAGGTLPGGFLEAAAKDSDPGVRRNAAHVAEVMKRPNFPYINALIGDPNAQVRVAALRAAITEPLSMNGVKALIAAWPKLDDDYQRSAAVAAAASAPAAVVGAALDSPDAAAMTPLVSAVTQNITAGDAAANLVAVLAGKPASADALKRSILDSLAKNVKDAPAMTPELSAALAKLLASGASGSALPLAAKWDKAGVLKGEIAKLTASLLANLAEDSEAIREEERVMVARNLLGLRGSDPKILPAIVAYLGKGRLTFQRGLIAALAETDDASVGAALSTAYAKLPADVQPAAFDAVLKRADWANAFLDAVKSKAIDGTTLGPAAASRLRTHPNKDVAKRAADMLDELNPMAKMRKEMIVKLAPLVEQKGDIANGKAQFTTLCAVCHKFGDVGADIGPTLTGMGAHGAGELLTAIADPNAEVDPSFVQWNIETKDGQTYAGIIAAENPASITLKSLAGVQEVKVANIKSRVNTGLSLMPDAFFGLPGEQLRDIIAFMQSVDGGKFRTLDLRDAFTANTARGIYASQDIPEQSLRFTKTGNVNVGGIPFNVVGPEKAAGGNNVVVLKGGASRSFSKSLPQRVEVKAGGFKANRIHFLGGVTGWGYLPGGETSDVMKVTIHTTQGQREGLVFKNGVEFADYIYRIDVPGSKYADGLVRGNQVRWFSKQLALGAVEIERITLESLDTGAAPTTVAITLELADANKPLPTAAVPAVTGAVAATVNAAGADDTGFKPQFSDPVPQPPAARPANGPRVLIVGGGSSHDFVKFFGGTDKGTLAPIAGWVDFTQNLNGIAPILDRVDVLVLSANQPISTPAKKALLDYVARGGALVAHHPGTWYAWPNFAQWNKEVVGGGSKGHDRFGEFEVAVTAKHPITEGVTEKFKITDELYYYKPDEAGTPIEVLATATSTQKPGTYPQVFIVKHPKARIVGLTLGHDAKAHDLPEYQALLKNAVKWAAGK